MRSALIAAIVGMLLSVSSPKQDPSQRPTFRGATDVVALDVSVQKRNAPVLGLTTKDFQVSDNGVPQSIAVQMVADVPVDVSTVFDRSLGGQISIASRYDAALKNIVKTLRAGDCLRVIEFARDVRETRPLSPIVDSSSAVLPDVAPSAAAGEGAHAGRGNQRWLDAVHDPSLERFAVFDGLLLAMAKPPEPGRRHLIVEFTFGVESGSVLTDGALLGEVAARTDALIQIGWWDRRILDYQVDGPQARYTRVSLTNAATATGGGARNFDDVAGAFKTIFAEFVQSYLITYTVTGVERSGWHTVTVKVPSHPDDTVRARSGYLGR
jgi:VWFA-related protein